MTGGPSADGAVDLCLANLYYAPRYSGAANRFASYAGGLAERDVRMRVFTGAHPDHAARPVRRGEVAPPEELDGIPVTRVGLPAGSVRRQYRTFWPALVGHVLDGPVRPQVVQLFSVSSTGWSAIARIRAAGVPLVFAHTIMAAERSGLRRAARALLWRRALHRFDVVVTSTSVMRSSLEAMGVATPIEVVPNGVDLARFRPASEENERRRLRAELGIRPDADVAVFVGPLTERKGVDLLVRAWAHVRAKRPGALLVLVGPKAERPDGAFEAALDSGLAALPQGSVRLTGTVDRPERWLRAADVFVLPTAREGMGNVILEAYASGTATVLTPFEGLATEHGREGREYLRVDREPQALASGLVRLFDDPLRRSALGAAGRRWAVERLGRDRVLDQLASTYREVAARGGGRRS